MKRHILTACLAMIASSSYAADEMMDTPENPVVSKASSGYLTKGTQEIGVQGSLDLDYVDDYLLTFNSSYGYFMKDNWEIGGEVDLTLSDNTEAYQLGAFTEYNFTNHSAWVPYIGLAAQYAYSEDDNIGVDNDAFNFQVAGGVKYFIHPQVAISAEVNYNTATEDIYYDGDGSPKDDKTQFLLGTRFYFK